MNESSRMITLFTEFPPTPRRPSAFAVSMIVHVLAGGFLYFQLLHAVKVEDESPIERYTVRLLHLQQPEVKKQRSAKSSAAQAVRASANGSPSAGRPAPMSAPRQVSQLVVGPQTIVQPDLPPNLLLPSEVPLPRILLWSPEDNPRVKMSPPPPQPVTTVNVKPSIERPNHELQLADLKVSASAFVTDTPVPLPSTTSPVVVPGHQPAELIPQTASTAVVEPAAAAVMSLSDIRLDKGTTALPQANQTAPSGTSESISAAREVAAPGNGNPDSASTHNGAGGQQSRTNQDGKGVAASGETGEQSGATGGTGANPKPGAEPDGGLDSPPRMTRIDKPRTGEFGVVVVGSSLAEQYPETIGLWGSRLAYSVYVQVGLPKSWILQYCLPPDAAAAMGSAAGRPRPPWPYVIERPQLAPGDINADAIMIHGFVNESGRFEKLSIVFPTDFSQTKFVLSALQQWQFRPAMLNGVMATVEVLLIIPEDLE